jgi:hypothetical protein
VPAQDVPAPDVAGGDSLADQGGREPDRDTTNQDATDTETRTETEAP